MDFDNLNNQSEGFEQEPSEQETENEDFNEDYATNNQTFAVNPGIYYNPVLTREKNDIKKLALASGISFILVNLLTYVVGFILYRIPVALGVSRDALTGFFTEPASLQIQQIVLSILFFTLPFAIVFKLSGYRISSLISFASPKKNMVLPMFLIGISVCAFANIALSVAGNLFQQFGIDYNVNYGENPKGFFGFLLSFIATAITPALVEEFACRGIVLGALRKYGDGFAIIVSSILFGLMHGNFVQIPFAFLVGVICGYIVVKTGSIWIAVAVHAFNNSASVILDYAFSQSSQVKNVIYLVFLIISLGLGILALLLVKDISAYTSIEKVKTECDEKKKYVWFFTSIPIIAFIFISLIGSLKYF